MFKVWARAAGSQGVMGARFSDSSVTWECLCHFLHHFIPSIHHSPFLLLHVELGSLLVYRNAHPQRMRPCHRTREPFQIAHRSEAYLHHMNPQWCVSQNLSSEQPFPVNALVELITSQLPCIFIRFPLLISGPSRIHFADRAMPEALPSESGTACAVMAASLGFRHINPVFIQNILGFSSIFHPKDSKYTASSQTVARYPSFPPL